MITTVPERVEAGTGREPGLPVRTCIGCGEKSAPAGLVRLALDQGRVIVDRDRRRQGRGAWLHPRETCLVRATRRKAFARAFRRDVGVEAALLRAVVDAKSP